MPTHRLGKREEWKPVHAIRIGSDVTDARSAVTAARKALGKTVNGNRLVGDPVHLLNPPSDEK
jgi:hypothetical protein